MQVLLEGKTAADLPTHANYSIVNLEKTRPASNSVCRRLSSSKFDANSGQAPQDRSRVVLISSSRSGRLEPLQCPPYFQAPALKVPSVSILRLGSRNFKTIDRVDRV